MRKILKLIWVVLGLAFFFWMWHSMQAKGVNKTILQSNAQMQITQTNDLISFSPKTPFQKVLIFYPGALVDPIAYAPLCRTIADSGYQVIIIKMPWRMATKGYNKPKEMNLFADATKQYVLAGHSQGAKMAAQFVYENPGLLDGLILLGTTHPRDIDLSKIQMPVLKISGTNDGVASLKEVNTNKPKLPPTTEFVQIAGGNHSQFGYYGFQLGDNKATISREKQQQLIAQNILSFLKSF